MMKSLSTRWQALVVINIAAVVFGSSALFGKLDISPIWIVGMRAFFAAFTLATVGILKKEIDVPPKRMRVMLFTSGIILALHWLTFFASIQLSGVAVATLTFAAYPLFTVLIEIFYHKRILNLAEVMAATAIIIAVGLLIISQISHMLWGGLIFGLISAFTFACFGCVSKQLGKTLSPLNISFLQNTIVGASLIPLLFLAKPAPHHIVDWMWLALLGIITTALMHQLYFYSLQRLSAATCSGFLALEPVYAIVFANLLFHETIAPWIIVSGALIIGASYIISKHDAPNRI